MEDKGLAEKTSQILSNFQDYMLGIAASPEAAQAGDGAAGARDVSEGGGDGRGEETVSFLRLDEDHGDLAGRVRTNNKSRIIGHNGSVSSGSHRRRREEAGKQRHFVSPPPNRHAKGFEQWDGMDSSTILTDPEDAHMLGRSQKRTHPMMKWSGGMKLAAFVCLVGVVVAVGVGVSLSGKGAWVMMITAISISRRSRSSNRAMQYVRWASGASRWGTRQHDRRPHGGLDADSERGRR